MPIKQIPIFLKIESVIISEEMEKNAIKTIKLKKHSHAHKPQINNKNPPKPEKTSCLIRNCKENRLKEGTKTQLPYPPKIHNIKTTKKQRIQNLY